MTNAYKEPRPAPEKTGNEPVAKQQKKAGIGRYINRVFNGEFLARDGMVNHIPFIAFLVGLFLLHISLIYYFENTERQIVRTLKETEELRTRYITTSSELHVQGLQSKIVPDVESMGIHELHDPPNIIAVEEGFMETDKK